MTKTITLLLFAAASFPLHAATTVFDFESQPLGTLTGFDQGDFRLTVSSSTLDVVFNDGNPGNAVGTNNGDRFSLTIATISGSPFEINSFDYSISSFVEADASLRISAPGFSSLVPILQKFESQTAGYVSNQSYNAPGGYATLKFEFTNEIPFDNNASIRVDNISVTSIPEPNSALLIGLGAIALTSVRRRRSK